MRYVYGRNGNSATFVCFMFFCISGMVSEKNALKIWGCAHNGALSEWLKRWKVDEENGGIISLPIFIFYFLWWAQNVCIFQNNFIPLELVVGLATKLTQ